MENQGPGLLVCDEELFDRVWGRVNGEETGATTQSEEPLSAPQTQLLQDSGLRPDFNPILPVPSPSAAALVPKPTPNAPFITESDPVSLALQRWVLRLLTNGEAYRAISSQAGKNRSVLAELGREKQRNAKVLAAEYFLRTGVRYWPRNSLKPLHNLSFLPSVRNLFLEERRQETDLRAQAAEEEPDLANRYLALADSAHFAANRLRSLLESLF